MKIVVLDGYTENPGDISWEPVSSQGEFTVYDRTEGTELAAERAHGAEVIFTNKTPVTRELLDKLPELKYIGVLATGYNVVDTEYAKEKGILVSNIPAYSTMAVAQHAAALLLEMCRHVGAHSESVLSGDWQRSKDFAYWKYPLVELTGKTMGIIGFGRIGRAFAGVVQAMGMNVLVCSRHRDAAMESDTLKYAGLKELYKNSDVISLHTPLTPESEGLINSESIACMKPGVMLINTARGRIVNEYDLAAALNSGKMACAAVDVVAIEPILPENPLLEAKNIIITPHIAWAAKETRQRLMDIAADNLKHFIDGNPINIVNL